MKGTTEVGIAARSRQVTSPSIPTATIPGADGLCEVTQDIVAVAW